MISKKVYLSLSEEEVAKFDMLRNELGMNRSQYFCYLLTGQKKQMPDSIRYKNLIAKNDAVTDFTLEDELRLGLLQDIDNFVIGEIKGGEALHVFTTAMSTGARFFGTIHSNDARTSVRKLVQCARYVSDYPMETLE